VRLCQFALDSGICLEGARLTVGGEPVTKARMETIRRAGAKPTPVYASMESATIGYGCMIPDMADDMHVLHDLVALIQPGDDSGIQGLSPHDILVSSIRPTSPFILLNVSIGDQAILAKRSCGCPLERLGWTTHLHTVQSYEKLTAAGMTFLDSDVISVLEEVLPARFGGSPTDYQLVEVEDEHGSPRLKLLVHPAVGPLDPHAVAEVFLTSISTGPGAERVMGLLWRDAKLLQVERRSPLATPSGEILHLHIEGRPGGLTAEQGATAKKAYR
jgi:hypothetical protein